MAKYSDDARKIVTNVANFCSTEKEDGLKIPLSQSLNRAAALTGVSMATIKRMKRRNKKEDIKPQIKEKDRVKDFDDFDKGVVRRTINKMYVQNKILPTLQNIKTALEEAICYTGSKSFLRKQLIRMGFRYRKCKVNRRILMEREDVVQSRIKYLRDIRRFREQGYNIVYTDETYVHTNHSVGKCWQDGSIGLNVPFSKGQRMIILHAGSKDGFVAGADLVFQTKTSSGDYHSEMNTENFMKWLSNKLIPNLPPKSVLIMDNAGYHNVQVDRCPTAATRKADIQDWLRRHNISFDDTLLKAELLCLCKQNRKTPQYVVDETLSSHGHRALRLPPYHADLNPIELIWGNLKGYVARKNLQFNLTAIKGLISEGIAAITSDDWEKCVGHVIAIEQQYWEIDIAVDKLVDPIVIHLASDSETSCDTDSGSDTETASEGEI